jgi:hypothetical protein
MMTPKHRKPGGPTQPHACKMEKYLVTSINYIITQTHQQGSCFIKPPQLLLSITIEMKDTLSEILMPQICHQILTTTSLEVKSLLIERYEVEDMSFCFKYIAREVW